MRALGIGAPILTLYGVLSGLLSSAGDTRTPFYGLVISQTIFKLGFKLFAGSSSRIWTARYLYRHGP